MLEVDVVDDELEVDELLDEDDDDVRDIVVEEVPWL